MRIGISPWVWVELLGTDDEALFDKAKALGFEGMEVAILNQDTSRLPIIERALKKTGLTPIVSTALPAEGDFIDPDPACHRRGQEFVRHCVDTAVRLGAETVIGPLSAAPCRLQLSDPQEKEREFERSARNLKIAGQYAADHGMRLAFEVMTRYECRINNTVEESLRLLEAVDSPAVGLLLDTFHMNIEEKSPSDAIRRAGKHLFHFHAIENDRGTPGSGSVDWFGVADALRSIQYPHWIIIEGFSTQAPWLSTAICQWRPFAPDMDELAREGLAFLQAIVNE